MADFLTGLGYPASAVIVFVILAYVWKHIFEKTFEKTLDVLIEDRKAQLSRETERLKTTLGIEAETYRLAAQRRFECLFSLWESSEALFEDTDFSSRESIRASLVRLDASVRDLNKYSVLMSADTVAAIKGYLEKVGRVVTNSEKNFDEHAITSDKISTLLKAMASPVSIISPAFSIAAEIGAAVVPSIAGLLEEQRNKAAIDARVVLEGILRKEFVVEEKLLRGAAEMRAQKTADPLHREPRSRFGPLSRWRGHLATHRETN
jgi:hypothetical protein